MSPPTPLRGACADPGVEGLVFGPDGNCFCGADGNLLDSHHTPQIKQGQADESIKQYRLRDALVERNDADASNNQGRAPQDDIRFIRAVTCQQQQMVQVRMVSGEGRSTTQHPTDQ